MIYFLDKLTLPGIFILFFALLIGIIFLFIAIMDKNKKELLLGKSVATDTLQKKYDSVNINKFKLLFVNVGMILSLAIVLAAFEFPDFEEQILIDLGTVTADEDEILAIPPTEQLPPPPPKVQQPEIIEIPDEEEIEEEIEVDLDIEMDEEEVVEEIVDNEESEEEEVVDQIFEIVEDAALPIGGYQTFYKFVKKNMKYPRQAKRMGIEGKVYVQFVVDKDGSITNIKVIRGIGAGADEEAARVLSIVPKWKPGKQRGRAVKQRIVLPISFKLG